MAKTADAGVLPSQVAFHFRLTAVLTSSPELGGVATAAGGLGFCEHLYRRAKIELIGKGLFR